MTSAALWVDAIRSATNLINDTANVELQMNRGSAPGNSF
jgi:hypothetical protein